MKKLVILSFLIIFSFAASLLEKLELECKSGNYKSCYLVGKAYFEGKIIKKDLKKAIRYFEKSCNGNYDISCNVLGYLYADGVGVKKDYGKVAKFFMKSCDLGNIEACYNLGYLYAKGMGVEKNVTKAINFYKWICQKGTGQYAIKACDIANVFFKRKDYKTAAFLFKRACKLGDKKSCYRYLEALDRLYQITKDTSLINFNEIGLMYYNGDGVDKNYRMALKVFKKGCELGDKDCCYNAGIMLNNGLGVEKNKLKALRFFKRGCELGDGDSCFDAGLMYRFGRGVTQDIKSAIDFYKKACKLGKGDGCYNLGVIYERGILKVKKDPTLAIKFYQKACQLGNSYSCFNAGIMYDYDEYGIKVDHQVAFEYYKKACELGDKKGCYNVAVAYKTGEGVEKNYNLAIKYYKKSCFDLNFTKSCKSGADLAMKLFNSNLAVKFYQKGCQLGDSFSCQFSGSNVTADPTYQALMNDDLASEILGLGDKNTNEDKLIKSCIFDGDKASCNQLEIIKQKLEKKCKTGNKVGCLQLKAFNYSIAFYKKYGKSIDEGREKLEKLVKKHFNKEQK